jgi:prepilin-type processing-associated H-X9-DG protein
VVRWRRLTSAALLPYFLLGGAPRAQERALETAVKATFLVKFAAFVEWPVSAFESPTAPLTICIVGSPLGGVADQAARGQSAGQHGLTVRHIAAATHGDGCNILFSDGTAEQSVAGALDAVRGTPVLTVTDQPETAARKGIINFVLQNGHVRFQIDDGEAAADGLRISSHLLSLAVNRGAR